MSDLCYKTMISGLAFCALNAHIFVGLCRLGWSKKVRKLAEVNIHFRLLIFQCSCCNVCRNCGRVVSNSYGWASTSVLRLYIRCDGRESWLGECRYRVRSDGDVAATHHCRHSSNLVAVECRHCHATNTRSRRNPVVPYDTNSDTSSSSGKSSRRYVTSRFILTSCRQKRIF